MNALLSIYRRELGSYFATPVAYVFIIIFLVLCGYATFTLGQFFDRGEADLRPFFDLHPWLYLFLVPAVSMRLWAEERRGGTIELLMTLPVPTWAAVLGKYLAAWSFIAIALILTTPLWVTVNNLGSPDNGVIAAAYLGSLLMAGAYLAVGAAVSAATKSQVIALIVSAVACFGLLVLGLSGVASFLESWAPPALLETIVRLSTLSRFEDIAKGVIDARDVLFFGIIIGGALIANTLIVESNKAG